MMSRIKILALMKLWEINSRSSEIYDKLIIHNLSDQYLNIKYLSNVSIKQIFVRPICHKYQNIRICEGNL